MPASSTAAAQSVLREFDNPWRDDTPVFGCCRRAVEVAVGETDILDVATLDVTGRVQVLRAAVDARMPDHMASHRCCAGHIADLAFDLPDLVAPADPVH